MLVLPELTWPMTTQIGERNFDLPEAMVLSRGASLCSSEKSGFVAWLFSGSSTRSSSFFGFDFLRRPPRLFFLGRRCCCCGCSSSDELSMAHCARGGTAWSFALCGCVASLSASSSEESLHDAAWVAVGLERPRLPYCVVEDISAAVVCCSPDSPEISRC